MSGVPDVAARWEVFGRPLRHLPRWAAAAVLLLTLLACLWSVPAVQSLGSSTSAANEERLESGSRRDFDLYQAINERIAAGEGYYDAALDEQRASGFPTKPFVTVRPPTLAWSSLVFGRQLLPSATCSNHSPTYMSIDARCAT